MTGSVSAMSSNNEATTTIYSDESDICSDESYDDENEAAMAANAREENKDGDRPLERSYILTFKNIEDAIDKFNDDDGKNIN
ncbi:hypothetical protein ALC53_12563 [Atta colombica]|uniref:Uncharacterized protein n=1 Tax=Atta colombica TaxID=520822 RepID=A0A195AYA9_9HYME|nr:hypothetical protein ALC53_12563 [Atta colombica]